MNLSRERYAKLLDEYGFWTFPRRVGNPEVVVVGNPRGFFSWFDRVRDAGRPVFIGHNALAKPPPNKPLDPYEYAFTHALGDFDLRAGNEKVLWEETQRFGSWAVAQDLPFGLIFTGTGTQYRVGFTPERRSFAYLSKWEKAFWEGVRRHLHITSLDMPCADPARLERLPFTRYSHCKDKSVQKPDAPPVYTPTDKFCIPLQWTAILEDTYASVVKKSRAPKLEAKYWHDGKERTLESFVREKGWQNLAPDFQPFRESPAMVPQGDEADLMRAYIPLKKCLQTLIFNADVGHTLLVAWIAEMAAVGIPPDEIVMHADRIADDAGWTNPASSPFERRRQADYVGRRGYKFSCLRLREKGLCVGQSCQLFAKSFPNESEKKT
jgi:hypothetical protein